MTHTATKVMRAKLGGAFMTITDVDITSYTASGEAITAGELGLAKILDAKCDSNEKLISFWWDRTNSKIRAFGDTTLATESTATTDCGKVRVLAFGY